MNKNSTRLGPILVALVFLLFSLFTISCNQDNSGTYTPVIDTSPVGSVPFGANARTVTDDTGALFSSGDLSALNDSTPTYSEFKDIPLGAQYNATQSGTAFRFFCPQATKVILCLYDSHDDDYRDPDGIIEMKPSGSGIWYIGTREAVPTGPLKYYRFKPEATTDLPLMSYNGQRLAEPQTILQDPYARANVQCDGHSIIIDPQRTSLTDATPFSPTPFTTPDASDLIIYEVHIGDFTGEATANSIPGVTNFQVAFQGKYLGLKEAIPYFKDLGINCIELMPIHEFTTDNTSDPHGYSWGYLPVLFFAPESGYATDHTNGSAYYELREFIDECHKQGIAVILDVVLTHTSNEYNVLYWADPLNRYYFHLDGDQWVSLGTGNWIAEGPRYNGSGPGPDKPFAKKLVLDNLRYWVEEFNVDGFRFDLIVGTSQDTLQKARSELSALNSKIFLTSENWIGSYRHDFLVGNGYSQWNDYFRESVKTRFLGEQDNSTTSDRLRKSIFFSKGVNDNIGFVRAYDPLDTTNYIESHDEQTVGNAVGGSWAKGAIGATVLMTSLGVPMVYEGQEFIRNLSKNQQQQQNESLQSIDWSWASSREDYYKFFRYLVRLRRDNPEFRLSVDPSTGYRTNLSHTGGNLAVGYVVNEDGSTYGNNTFVILVNMHNYDVDFTLPTGTWKAQCAVLGNGDPLNNTDLVFLGDGKTVPAGNDFDKWGTSNSTWLLHGYSAVILKKQ